MVKSLALMVVCAVFAYLALCAFLYMRQRTMLYYPTIAVTYAGAESFWLSNEGQRLKVWHISGNSDKALIYFGGNAEDVSINIPQFKALFGNYSIYLHNYRGYGGSTGAPTENGLVSDARALFDHLQDKHEHISVMGRSLGTGVAIALASERRVNRLVLVTPYDSMAHLASTYYPFFPVSLLLKDTYDSLSRSTGIDIPTLLLIAEHDEIIPRRISESLSSALKSVHTTVTVIRGAGHNTIETFPSYEKALTAFLN